MGIHSEACVFNLTLYIEGSTYWYHDKYCNDVINKLNVKMEFHSHFLDDSAQNLSTICEVIKSSFTRCMREFFIKDVIIYDTKDECIKKYRCANSLWILSVLSFT